MRKIINFAAMLLVFVACENYYMEGEIKTFEATDITAISARLSGKVEISYRGGDAEGTMGERGFIVNGKTYTVETSGDNFSINVYLTPNTRYEAKAYVKYWGKYSDSHYFYGNTIKFTTKAQ